MKLVPNHATVYLQLFFDKSVFWAFLFCQDTLNDAKKGDMMDILQAHEHHDNENKGEVRLEASL
jgi:hypothetical protein